MNLFRISADLSHLISIFILIHTIQSKQSVKGISLKSQVLYAIVYITRYLDLFFSYSGFYNTVMKIVFISSSIYVIYLMKKYSKKIIETTDDFKVEYLIGGSFILSLIFNYEFTIVEILWSFSLWLESVAILPQLFMLQKTGTADSITVHYIFALGIYRTLYIPNWIYRYISEGRLDKLAVVTGIIQTLVYSDFFYVYYQKIIKSIGYKLPQ